MLKAKGLFWIGTVLLTLALMYFNFVPHSHRETASATRMTRPQISLLRNEFPNGGLPEIVHSPPQPTTSRAYAESFKKAANYLLYIQSVLDDARAGDPNAQYYLGKALQFCEATSKDSSYGIFLHQEGAGFVFAQPLQYADSIGREVLAPSVEARCHDLENRKQSDAEFGTASDWIALAAASGQPAAESALALDALNHLGNGSLSSAPSSAEHIDGSDAARDLLLTAAISNDPEALWNVGTAQGAIAQSYDDKVTNQLAWWLISCDRGLDCSADADWIRLSCKAADCPTFADGTEFIRFISAERWDLVESRAKEISQKIDAGQWSQLGIQD